MALMFQKYRDVRKPSSEAPEITDNSEAAACSPFVKEALIYMSSNHFVSYYCSSEGKQVNNYIFFEVESCVKKTSIPSN
jgi:hypothetical protein